MAHGRIPVKATEYRQRYDDLGNPVSKSYMSLQGLGVASGTALDGTLFHGVLIENTENMDIRLGRDGAADTKSDTFTLKSSVTGKTTLVLGGGNDTANVEAINGETDILGGSGNDTVNVTDSSSHRVQSIRGQLVTEGDANLKDDVQTVLYDDLEPLFKDVVDHSPLVFRKDADNVVRKVPIVVKNTSVTGPAQVWVNVAKIDPATGQIVKVDYQDEIAASIGDVTVTQPASKQWSLVFPNNAGRGISDLSVEYQNLVGVSVIPSASGATQQIYQTGTGGTFSLTLNGRTTAAIPYDASAAILQAALESAGVVTGGSGLRADYYNVGHSISRLSDIDFSSTPTLTATVPNIDFAATSGGFWDGGPSDYFAVRLTGTHLYSGDGNLFVLEHQR